MGKLKVHSIFDSISGEAGILPQGTWCTFIRLQGCNLRCFWCDTPTALDPNSGDWMEIEDIVRKCTNKHILITGGEPLLQREGLIDLINLLHAQGGKVQIETNGSLPIPPEKEIPAAWVVDIKPPSSGQNTSGLPWGELLHSLMGATTIVKFVIDPHAPKDILNLIGQAQGLHRAGYRRPFIVSPLGAKGEEIPHLVREIGGRAPSLLNRVVFSVQLHKLLDLP